MLRPFSLFAVLLSLQFQIALSIWEHAYIYSGDQLVIQPYDDEVKPTQKFSWYSYFNWSTSKETTVKVWLVDLNIRDPPKTNETVTSPSKQSQVLTKLFMSYGQEPIIYSPNGEPVKLNWNKAGYWDSALICLPTVCNFQVYGKSVGWEGQLAENKEFTFYWPATEAPQFGEKVALYLSSEVKFKIIEGICEAHRALVLTDQRTYRTDSAFENYTEIYAYDISPSQPSSLIYEDAVLLINGALFLISKRLYWRAKEDGIFKYNPVKLPTAKIFGIRTQTKCLDLYPHKDFEVIAWSQKDIYIGGGPLDWKYVKSYFSIVRVPNINRILTVNFASTPYTLAVLVMHEVSETVEQPQLMFYDYINASWWSTGFVDRHSELNFEKVKYELLFINSAQQSFLVWNSSIILYSYYDGEEEGYLNVQTQLPDVYIQQVLVDPKYNVIVKMSNNVMCAMFAGAKTLSPLKMILDPAATIMLYITPRDQILMLFRENNTFRLDNRDVLSTVTSNDTDCPFIAFTHSLSDDFYFFDKRRRFKVNATLRKTPEQNVTVLLLTSRRDLINFTEETRVVMDAEIKTYTLFQDIDYTKAENYSKLLAHMSGIVSVEIRPNHILSSCTVPSIHVFRIFTGCSELLSLKFVKPPNTPCEENLFNNYTIPGSELRSPQEDDQVVPYDWNSYGCLLKMHYKTKFRPELHLYDGEDFVSKVNADFIVWDIFGRMDYHFSASARQVGCQRDPQSWKLMLQNEKNMDSAWGPENYKSCFQEGDFTDPDQEYQIMNMSSENYITFSVSDSAIYVFRIKMLDPNYSFCNLQTTFSVMTTGIKKQKVYPIMKYVYVIFVITILIILSICYYNYLFIFREMCKAEKYQ